MMRCDNSIEARKKRVLRRNEVGTLIAGLPFFVDGMSDYDLEQERNRYYAYIEEHKTDEGFVRMTIKENDR